MRKDKLFWLERFDNFFISGSDAKRFLNGMTTTNMTLDTKVAQTCWLTPSGGLRSLLEIYFDDEKLTVIILQGHINEIRNYFEDMIFPSDNVSLSESSSIWRIQEVNETNSWRSFIPEILLVDDPKDYCYENQISILENHELQEWKIKQAIPVIDVEIDGKINPLELGLYDLIDFNKGCYLGQEIMARLNKVSSLKQEIRSWISHELINNSDSKDNKIYLKEENDKVVGFITSFNSFNSKNIIGLAMIKKNYLTESQTFFSKKFGFIDIYKSVSSVFL